MTHVLSTDDEIQISRCDAPTSAIRKLKLGLASAGSIIVGCGRLLISISSTVGRAFEMAYIDPYAPPQNRSE